MSPDGSVKTVVDGRELTISNLEKVFYPDSGFTKGQMLDYYVRVAPIMLAHIRDRPLTMKRFPNGIDGPHFFEKHVPVHAPDWLKRVSVPSNTEGGVVEYGVICDTPGLIWAANLGTVEFHVPLWHVGRRRVLPAPPDHMVFDLDPGTGTSIVECCIVGRHIADLLADGERACLPKTSGSKGLQIYVPLSGRPTWETVRRRALAVATQLEREHPDLIVSNMRKELRKGKVAHRLEPEPLGQDHRGRLLTAGPAHAHRLDPGDVGRGGRVRPCGRSGSAPLHGHRGRRAGRVPR